MTQHGIDSDPQHTAGNRKEYGFIKKLNKEKGYAFIDPESGGNDVFLSLMDLARPGTVDISIGMRIAFRRYRAANGKQRATDVSIAQSASGTRRAHERRPTETRAHAGTSSATMPGTWQEATVKFYDPEKGYGFVEFPNGGKDAFLSRYTVQSSQLDPNVRLKQVPARVITIPGTKQGSLDVFSIELI